MSNILAIVQKELRSYFASPIAYVILGMFALLFGWFYVAILNIFVQQSMQMGSMGMGGPVNVNQQMIRYVFQNSLVVNLFVVPLITMRTYAEEKRSGTIELLMTSPLTDFQIIMGKFIGALAIYASMLAVTLVHMAVLFVYGNPEWKPIATAYLGMLLMGGCFLAVGLL
ncbi:MAG: ABC transporter permease subunit, partial [Chloroflexi bacterium]|nr:ABC transporter permease subunit [Chloroflexota bacterium]